ncbi:MAG: M50 family metallopeptidase [Anaerolineae bacterium]|nr:M50 family metallopeptidase [Anaerolineae bacterium]
MATGIIPGKKPRRAGFVVAGALVVTVLLWQLPEFLRIPELSVLVYPFRLFVTLVHELGHGVAAMLTGGEFMSLEVMANGAGLATTRGGARFVIIQMGYLGASFFGAAMLLLANKLRNPRWLTALVGLFCGGVTVFLGVNLATKLIGGAVFALAILLAFKGPEWLNLFALNLLAMMVGLNALMDIWGLLSNLDTTVSGTPNDALAMQKLTYLPAALWAALWVVISVAVLGGAVYAAFIRPMRQK